MRNELSLNQWVRVQHAHREPTNERVYGIGQDVILINYNGNVKSFEYDKVSPVSLTLDILMCNGFTKRDNRFFAMNLGKGYVLFWNTKDNRLTKEYEGVEFNDISYLRSGIKYVHELQDALSSCGCEELAMNFIV